MNQMAGGQRDRVRAASQSSGKHVVPRTVALAPVAVGVGVGWRMQMQADRIAFVERTDHIDAAGLRAVSVRLVAALPSASSDAAIARRRSSRHLRERLQ
ncbi:MAG: hypothetical protein H6945_08155 [Zoogloeaceae bacterium]|nr:hypothetical protein [Rhodocyclaceae bacterium]MCP5235694.1 hypothetical protein [Zoogloeaceae bacterium]